MKIKDTKTPVVIVNCKLSALGIMRSLGSQGVPVYGVDADPASPAMLSSYCKGRFLTSLNENNQEQFLEQLLKIGKGLGRPSILIPTSDETSVFVAERAEELGERFIFPRNDPRLIKALMDKKDMFFMAGKYDVPTAYTEFPQNVSDVKEYIKRASFWATAFRRGPARRWS